MKKERYGSECIKMDMVDFHKLKHNGKVEFARRLCRELNVNHLKQILKSANVKSIKVDI